MSTPLRFGARLAAVTALLIDLDGTLLDTAADLAGGANAARAHFGLPPLPIEAVAAHVGWGLGHLLTRTLPVELHPRMEEARAAFHACYAAHLLDHSRPYPGASALLEAWRGPLALVTNKPRAYVVPILEALGWVESFQAVVTGDDARKPAPEALWRALEGLGVAPEDALFVGDSEVDRDAAAAAGVAFVAVPWGRVATERRASLVELAAW